jgi:hypothetical protein
MRHAHKGLVEISERKTPHSRQRCKYEDKIKMNLKEIWCETVDWVQSTHDSRESLTVSSCEHGNKPSGSIQNRDLLDQLSDSKFNKSTVLS